MSSSSSSVPLPALNDHGAWDALAQDLAADESDWSASASDQTDPYSILNIARASTAQDVRVRYRQMSLLFHPDRHQAGPAAAAVFPVVSAASTTLSAPADRAAFDVLGELRDDKSRYDAFSETLLSRAELEAQALHGAVQTELDRRQRLSHSQLDCSAGPDPGAFEAQSQVQVDLGSGYDAVGVAATVSCTASARQPTSLLQISWSRTHDLWTSSKAALGLGGGALSLDLIATRKLSASSSGQMCVGARARLGRLAATLWFRLLHAFSDAVVGTLTLTLAPVPTLSCNLSRRPALGSFALSGGVRMAGPGSGLEATIRYRLDRRYHVFAELRGALIDSSVEIGIGRRFPHAAPGLTVAYSLLIADAGPGGVLAQLRVERGPCRLRLPLPLAATGDDASPAWKLLLLLPLLAQAAAVLAGRRLRPRLSSQGVLYVQQRAAALGWQRRHRAEAQRIGMREEDENGLVIVAARYGDLSAGTEDGSADDGDRSGRQSLFPPSIDAVVPLQILVRDGRLQITGPLATVPGLFPVRHGPHCRLAVRYRFDCVDHAAVLADGEPVSLPDPAHIVPTSS